jgi:uncharacterized membrane protein
VNANEHAHKLRRDWGEGSTLLVVFALLFALPNRYTLGGPIVSFTILSIFALTCLSSFVTTAMGSRRLANIVIKAGAVVLAIGILASMFQVIDLIVHRGSQIDGLALLETALTIWVSNVTIFAMIYHMIGEGEFLFPRRDGEPGKPMVFLDFLFLSFTTSTAFSPTDTAPLSTRTRMLMMVESIISLTMIALAAARAVNILT